MSWAEEDWTVGLTGRVLQKVKELQVHHERLSRENKQKQLQLDNIHISLEKQTAKYEEVRVELQSVQRELQGVQEEAKAAVTSKGRLTQEVQTKQAQVCSLEGQLDAARTLNNKLTQDIKRLEAELEKLQNSSRLADTPLFSTPCWSKTSPWEHSGSRQEGQRDEAPARAHSRRLQFSDDASPSLPRQQHHSTPHRHPSDQSDVFSTPSAAFPWEREDSKPAARRRVPPSSQTPPHDVTNQELSEPEDCGKNSRLEADKLCGRISALEEELSGKTRALKSIQNEQMQSKKELAAKELSLQRARDELSAAQTRIAQDSDRASAAEHRLKQLQEELKCQRQNAESSRLQQQQRTKELEKQHQRDLTELQRERQSLERQHQQEVNKLNQELQHARTQHNALQAQADKLSLQKQALEKDLSSVKEKLKWTEGQLAESQKKETQTQAKLTEAVREAEGVAVSLEQSRKRERALEEEGRRLAEERADALRLVKDLQEQKLVSAAPIQPAPFSPVSQGFLPQSSFSPPARTQTKRPAVARAEHRRVEEEEEEVTDGRRTEVTASYPSDREPGEGIDSEHITALSLSNPECVEKAGRRGKSNEEESKSTGETATCGISDAAGTLSNTSVDGAMKTEPVPRSSTPPASETSVPSQDLKKENAMLRSELQDVREELQRRLEDLEAQRRAETEARTRLKQLSRKQASQAVEKEEKHKEWKAQLESERAETERLRKTIAALEAEMKRERDRNAREEEEEERNKEQEDRVCEMTELNIQLKNQLADLKTQLAVEREERKQEKEREKMQTEDLGIKEDLSLKVSELTAELEKLKCRLKEESQEEEKLSAPDRPLTYLSLHDDELNSNKVCSDNKTLPSPEQHLALCQSANQRNMLVSQSTAQIIQEEQNVIDPEYVQGERDASDLSKEVEHLKRESTKEAERANRYQVKLEALQSQVTRQTLQLTTAFEKQSQHIAGLLAELQEKEMILLSQGEELLRCKSELEALRTDGEKPEEGMVEVVEDEGNKEGSDDKMGQIPDLKSKQELAGPLSPHTTKSAPSDTSNSPKDDSLPKIETSDSETPTADGFMEDVAQQPRGHPDSNQTVAAEDQSSKIGGTADTVTELLALQRENQLLKQRIEGFVLSSNQEDRAERSQNTGNAALSSLMEDKTHNVVNDVLPDGQEMPRQSVNRRDEEGRELEVKIGKTSRAEEDQEEASQTHVNLLQHQVEALQLKIRTLSEEMQQQAEELALWRLSSQPAPAFDADEQQDGEEQISAVRLTHQQQADEPDRSRTQTQNQTPAPASQRRQENVTVIREDDVLLSCTSNKIQGRMLFSRLQNSILPEPKTLQPSKKHNEDTTNVDQESEKENQEFNVFQQSGVSPAQCKTRRDTEVVQMSEKTVQQHAAKDDHRVSGASLTKPDCHVGKPEAKPNPSRETNEINTTGRSSGTDARTDARSVGVQTDDGLSRRGAPAVCVTTQTEPEEDDGEESADSPPGSPATPPGRDEPDADPLFAGSFPIPADPARLAERIRRSRTQLSAAFDDTEYEPYGLPEVVMKGFADIPTGPSCPYIVRRGLLGTTVVPASQKDSAKEEETD
ncbi:centromere protein F [Salarias fasciatus]|uniref:Centromere protein F-like n=1 Tax=Salarias fasciatus TaxID=181472 RepID=A0A672GEE6_SALFA|nr:centromere protein F-like [Salarias fasciatus]XP_029966586.1 centromere protein F-like [Salarias fasciatus]